VVRQELKIVSHHTAEAGSNRMLPVVLIAVFFLAVTVFATLSGAGSARQPILVDELANQIIERTLIHGSDDATVRSMLVEIRREIGRRPLQSRTRVTYSAVLLSLSKQLADLTAVSFHASQAARLSPTTVPILQIAVRVLARTGDADQALTHIHEMFAFDAAAASGLLSEMEPQLSAVQLVSAIPDLPEAWWAWCQHLRRSPGRMEHGDQCMEQASDRWPQNLRMLIQVTGRAAEQQDWGRLAELLPQDRELPDEPLTAQLLTYRARLRTASGDQASAYQDLDRAITLAGSSSSFQILAGDAYAALDDPEEARKQWKLAMRSLPVNAVHSRRDVLLRMARLEDRFGLAATALRIWESVLDLEPDHPEATRRVRELTGL
jgi:tetratricopeptide (TPR) repeat protein